MKTILTIGTIALVLSSASASAQTSAKKPRGAQGQPQQVVCAGAWLMGRVLSRDPDPHIRAAMLRDYSGIGAHYGMAYPGARDCIR
jgi:hypothetical protein